MSASPDNDFGRLAELDKTIHEPARLAVMAVLLGCKSADFEFLLNMTSLTKGNLSAHTAKLEQAGYVEIEKGFRGKVPYTRYRLTKKGRKAFGAYRKRLSVGLARLDKVDADS